LRVGTTAAADLADGTTTVTTENGQLPVTERELVRLTIVPWRAHYSRERMLRSSTQAVMMRTTRTFFH
jgi:hypothetical protein